MSSAPVLDTLTHIETPENVRLAFRLAGPGSRLGAYLLDLLIRCAILWGLSMTTAVLFPLLGASSLPIGIWHYLGLLSFIFFLRGLTRYQANLSLAIHGHRAPPLTDDGTQRDRSSR